MRALALALLLVAVPAMAQMAPLEAFQTAKAQGVVPAWADVTDRVRLLPAYPTTARVCIENRQGPGRWVLVGSLSKLTDWYDTGLFDLGPAASRRPATTADIQACWPDYVAPAPLKSVAIGEPVYRAIVHTKATTPPYWRNDTPLDWAVMNASYRVRSSVAGEACQGKPLAEPAQHVDTTVGWYVVANGMTRCKP